MCDRVIMVMNECNFVDLVFIGALIERPLSMSFSKDLRRCECSGDNSACVSFVVISFDGE